MLHTSVVAAFSKVCTVLVSVKKQEGSIFILNLGLSPISGITVCQFIDI